MARLRLPALFASAASLTCGAGVLGAQGRVHTISQSDARQAQQQHPQVTAEFGGAMTGPVASYVQEIGRRVGVHAGVSGGANAFTFTTLNSPVMNAFAITFGDRWPVTDTY